MDKRQTGIILCANPYGREGYIRPEASAECKTQIEFVKRLYKTIIKPMRTIKPFTGIQCRVTGASYR